MATRKILFVFNGEEAIKMEQQWLLLKYYLSSIAITVCPFYFITLYILVFKYGS